MIEVKTARSYRPHFFLTASMRFYIYIFLTTQGPSSFCSKSVERALLKKKKTFAKRVWLLLKSKMHLSSKFHTDTIPVRDKNNDTAYAIACSLEAAHLLSKLIPQLQRCKPRKAYETNKGKLNLGQNQRASTGWKTSPRSLRKQLRKNPGPVDRTFPTCRTAFKKQKWINK